MAERGVPTEKQVEQASAAYAQALVDHKTPSQRTEFALTRAFAADPVVLRAEADKLAEAIEEYSLWEPGRRGHAAALHRLRSVLAAYHQSSEGL